MNKKYDAKINMFIQVENVLEKFPTVVDSSPAFMAASAHFTEQLDIILGKKQPLSLSMTGIAEDKQHARESLSKLLVVACNALMAYAEKNNNKTMYQQANFNHSIFMRMRGLDLVSTAQAIHSLATQYRAELASYNLNAGTLESLAAAITTFNDFNTAPRTNIIDSKTNRNSLYQMVEDLNKYIRFQMDKLAKTFADSEREFFALYTNARRNYSEGVRHRKLEAAVQQSIAALPDTAAADSFDKALKEMVESVTTENGVPA